MSFFGNPENEGLQYGVLQLMSCTWFFTLIAIRKALTDLREYCLPSALAERDIK